MPIVVQKYGGTSVHSVERIEAAAHHIKQTADEGNDVIVVVSAMGTHTDELLKMAYNISDHPSSREVDMLLSAGERVSMALMSIALHKVDIDSVSLTGSQCGILTDGVHGNAKIKTILGDRIRQGISDKKVVIVAGFQGVDPETKEITTLGRGGSDLTAVALASSLKADSCELYKDVPGVLTADPRVVKSAVKLDNIDYKTMLALSTSGASVVHNRSIHLAEKFGIPIKIRSSINLDEEGTLISGENKVESPEIKAITSQKSLCHLQLKYQGTKSRGLALADALKACWAKGVTPIISRQASQNSTTIIDVFIPQGKAEEIIMVFSKQDRHEKLVLESHRFLDRDLSSLSVVGNGFLQAPEIVEEISSDLDCPRVVSMQVSDDRINYVFNKLDLSFEINGLHKKFLESN
ncbi:aspartate kinase [bacterium]|nr:aspartate kinase [bacterium]